MITARNTPPATNTTSSLVTALQSNCSSPKQITRPIEPLIPATIESNSNSAAQPPVSYRMKWAVSAYNCLPESRDLSNWYTPHISENNLFSATACECCLKTLSAPFVPVAGVIINAYLCLFGACMEEPPSISNPDGNPCVTMQEKVKYASILMFDIPFFKTTCQTAMCCCAYCAGAIKDACCKDSKGTEKPTAPTMSR